MLHAYQKGDKLKFANHSPNLNCYVEVIMVARDDKVGISINWFVQERNYLLLFYELDWALACVVIPKASGSKQEYVGLSTNCAKKHTSTH